MTLATNIQGKLASKVFDKLGSSASLKTVSSTVVDKWGDATYTYATSTAITIVPYGYISQREFFAMYGDLKENEFDAILKHSESFAIGSIITYDSNDYIIKTIEKYPLADDNLAFQIRAVKQL